MRSSIEAPILPALVGSSLGVLMDDHVSPSAEHLKLALLAWLGGSNIRDVLHGLWHSNQIRNGNGTRRAFHGANVPVVIVRIQSCGQVAQLLDAVGPQTRDKSIE